MKRAVSTGNSSLSIHQNLYNKSIAQQEEGPRRRQEGELRFLARNIRRHKLSLKEEIAKPKKQNYYRAGKASLCTYNFPQG